MNFSSKVSLFVLEKNQPKVKRRVVVVTMGNLPKRPRVALHLGTLISLSAGQGCNNLYNWLLHTRSLFVE